MSIQESLGIHQLDKVERFLGTNAEFIASLLIQQSKKGGFIKDGQKAAKLLIQHINRGKTIENIVVEEKNAELMRSCLESFKIPYVSIMQNNQALSTEEIIIIRDSDRRIADKALERFKLETGNGLGELEADKLIELNKNKDITVVHGIDSIFVELFRKHSQLEGLPYSFKESTNQIGKYDIYCMSRDKDRVDNILKQSAYDLSGENGHKLANTISNYINSKDLFDTKLRPRSKNEEMYVVDTKNPTKFIAVTRDGYSKHQITSTKDGELVDINSNIKPSYNRDDLFLSITNLYNPVILTKSEFTVIKGINESGKAEPIDKSEFDKSLEKLRKTLNTRTDFLPSQYNIDNTINYGEIHSIHNLNEKQCIALYSEIQKAGVEESIIYGNSLSYTDRCKETMEKAICKVLYNELDALHQKEAEIYHEGRGNIILADTCSYNQYLVDADNPNLSITITPIGFALCSSGKIVLEKERLNDTEYDNHLLQSVKALSSPVALNETEMRLTADERITIIKSRIPDLQTCASAEYLKNKPEREMANILNLTYRDNYKADNTLSEREKEAVEKLKEFVYEDIFVDRTILEKITDQTIEKSIKSERVHNGNGVDRITFDR